MVKSCVNRALFRRVRNLRLKFTASAKMRVEDTPLSLPTTDRNSFFVSVVFVQLASQQHACLNFELLAFLILGTADVTGDCKLKEGTEMVMPGDNTTIDIELITPVPIEAGLRFNIREGGRTVGTGIVTKVHG